MHVPRRKERMVGWCVQIGAPGEGLFSSLPQPPPFHGYLYQGQIMGSCIWQHSSSSQEQNLERTLSRHSFFCSFLHYFTYNVRTSVAKWGKGAEGDEKEEAN